MTDKFTNYYNHHTERPSIKKGQWDFPTRKLQDSPAICQKILDLDDHQLDLVHYATGYFLRLLSYRNIDSCEEFSFSYEMAEKNFGRNNTMQLLIILGIVEITKPHIQGKRNTVYKLTDEVLSCPPVYWRIMNKSLIKRASGTIGSNLISSKSSGVRHHKYANNCIVGLSRVGKPTLEEVIDSYNVRRKTELHIKQLGKKNPKVYTPITYDSKKATRIYNQYLDHFLVFDSLEKDDYRYTQDQNGQRIHTVISNMPSLLRKYLRSKNGKPLAIIDAINSQWLLTGFMFDPKARQALEIDDVAKKLAKELGIKESVETPLKNFLANSEDIKYLIAVTKDGVFYELLARYMSYIDSDSRLDANAKDQRRSVKSASFKTLYGAPWNETFAQKWMANLFPNSYYAWASLANLKENFFPLLMQRIESNIFNEKMLKPLYKCRKVWGSDSQPFLCTLHDGIIVEEENAEQVYQLMSQLMEEELGFTMPLSIELWASDEKAGDEKEKKNDELKAEYDDYAKQKAANFKTSDDSQISEPKKNEEYNCTLKNGLKFTATVKNGKAKVWFNRKLPNRKYYYSSREVRSQLYNEMDGNFYLQNPALFLIYQSISRTLLLKKFEEFKKSK